MKRFLIGLLCVGSLFTLCGCGSKNSDTYKRIRSTQVNIELADVPKEKYTSLSDADDDIYDLQLSACDLYIKSYNVLNASNFKSSDIKGTKLARACYEQRKEINKQIEKKFYQDLYLLVKNCSDCTNTNAFLAKAHKDVLGFYDSYAKYLDAENPDDILIEILIDYSQKRNVLALSFLERHKREVLSTAINTIEKNAESEDNMRFYVNKNINIKDALEEVYDNIPEKYSERIEEAHIALSMRLLDSLKNITEREKNALIEQLQLATPSPSPSPTPSPTPTPTPKPTPSPTPTPTPKPAATPTAPAQVRITPTPDDSGELPSYNFSVN